MTPTKPETQHESLNRDETLLENGDITQIKAQEEWALLDPDNPNPFSEDQNIEDFVVEVYLIRDCVTDAISTRVQTADGSPIFDYNLQEFRDDARNGLLVPKKYLTNTDPETLSEEFTHL